MDQLIAVLTVIRTYLFGFDLFILIFAVLTACFYILARRFAIRLHKTLHITVFLPEYALQKKKINPMSEIDLVELRKRANGFYSVFVNLTSIFPLLGIFGTVISLLPMVSQIDSTQQSFFTALTSTFWGLVFAIVFKFLDGFLASRIDENNNNITLYLERKRSVPEETPCEAEAS